MPYKIHRDILVVDEETGHPIARARGSDEDGWMAMSITDNGMNRSVRSGFKFRTLREALADRVLPAFHGELDEALSSWFSIKPKLDK